MNDIYPYLERAQLLLAQGRANDAIAQLKNALQQDPGSDEALSLYARCQFAQKDYDAGIQTMNNAISIDPENSYYFYLLGFGYYSANKNIPALEAFKQSQEMDPYFSETYGLMSHVYVEQKDFNKALATANEGLAIDPENITCLNARSIAQNKLHKTDDAINTMQNALAQDPDNEYTHCTVGWNYLEKGQHKIATKHFKEALRINPNMHNAQAGLKEALKSKIAPYRWLLRYSFWINNKGKKMRWIIPVGLYITVRLLSSLLKMKEGTEYIVGGLIALYFLFILTSWLITPLANFFLLFHKDGKYALTQTE
ncbi:MAG TPA: tetratricopeptide repeat protein, partial [Ferruginibacter sp.]|nr:tetratricopeptide repeat protein [Ferruginibacter sp.]